jgi:hypothetical protein
MSDETKYFYNQKEEERKTKFLKKERKENK